MSDSPVPRENPATLADADANPDRLVLAEILVHRSQMHMLTLQQQLLLNRDHEGNAKFAPGELTSVRFLRELVIQLAIETVLLDDDVRSQIEAVPANLQIAYDTMYYLSRTVLSRSDEWTLPNHSELRNYLDEKSNSPELSIAEERPAAPPPVDDSTAEYAIARQGAISAPHVQTERGGASEASLDSEVRFWHAHLQHLVGYLVDPEPMRSEWDKRVTSESSPGDRRHVYIEDKVTLLNQISELPPVLEQRPDDKYRWLFDQYFLTRSGSRDAERAPRSPDKQAALIKVLAGFLSEISEGFVNCSLTLAARHRVFPGFPAWQEVERAVSRIEASKSSTPGDSQARTDAENVSQFVANLEKHGEVLAGVLESAALLGQCQPKFTTGKRLATGLDVISNLFSLRHRPAHSVDIELLKRLTGLFDDVPIRLPSRRFPAFSQNSADRWIAMLNDTIARLRNTLEFDEKRLRGAVEVAWNLWYSRFWGESWDTKTPFLPATDEELLAAAAGRGPYLFLDSSRSAMTLRRWSKAFLGAALDLRAEDVDQCPFWLAAPALRELGFSRPVLERLLVRVRQPELLGYKSRNLSDKNQLNLQSYDPERWARLAEGDRPGALIIGTAVVRNWKPSRDNGCLLLKVEEVQMLQNVWASQGSPLREFGFRYLVFSLPIAKADLGKCGEIRNFFQDPVNHPGQTAPPQIAFMARNRDDEVPSFAGTENVSLIIQPKNLSDLIRRLDDHQISTT